MVKSETCPVCGALSAPFREVDGFAFFACQACGLIHLDAKMLVRIDSGERVVEYSHAYWANEMPAARERAFGIALARAAEVFLCSRRPIVRFLDVGTGPGTFLDAVDTYLPHITGRFHAVELFPPPGEQRTRHPNYHVGRVGDCAADSFDGGICIEVIEHLTPAMVDRLLAEISHISRENACFIVNTGLAAYVRSEDPAYLDPAGRGHITIWTVDAIGRLARRHGLLASAVAGRNWCFLLEKTALAGQEIIVRLQQTLPENLSSLVRPGDAASPIALLGQSSLRESHHFNEFVRRTEWALQLDEALRRKG